MKIKPILISAFVGMASTGAVISQETSGPINQNKATNQPTSHCEFKNAASVSQSGGLVTSTLSADRTENNEAESKLCVERDTKTGLVKFSISAAACKVTVYPNGTRKEEAIPGNMISYKLVRSTEANDAAPERTGTLGADGTATISFTPKADIQKFKIIYSVGEDCTQIQYVEVGKCEPCETCTDGTCKVTTKAESIVMNLSLGAILNGDSSLSLKAVSDGALRMTDFGAVGAVANAEIEFYTKEEAYAAESQPRPHATQPLGHVFRREYRLPIRTIKAGSKMATFEPLDPNQAGNLAAGDFVIKVSHDINDPENSVFRRIEIRNKFITDPVTNRISTVTTMSDTYEGHTWVNVWTKTKEGANRTIWEHLKDNETQKTVIEYTKSYTKASKGSTNAPSIPPRLFAITKREKTYLKNEADEWELVSDLRSGSSRKWWGWVQGTSIIDPDGENLITGFAWGRSEGIDTLLPSVRPLRGSGSIADKTRRTGYKRYDGSIIAMEYDSNRTIIQKPFQGENGKCVEETTYTKKFGTPPFFNNRNFPVALKPKLLSYTADTKTFLKNSTELLSRVVTIYETSKTTTRVYTSKDNYLESSVEYYSPGEQDFAYQLKKQTRVDGTITLYSYARSGGIKTTTIKTGQPNAEGSDVVAGFKTVTRKNKSGKVVTSITTHIETGKVTNHVVNYNFDQLDRPLSTGYFPDSNGQYAYSEHRTYNCCGVESTTDKTGVVTRYAYDDLLRVVKTNRLGVTIQTAYYGLTTKTYRYAESAATATDKNVLLGNASNEISRTVRNVAGTQVESWARSAKDGSMQKLSSSATQYDLGEGVASRTVTTYLKVADEETAPTSTTETYLDGRTYQSFGDMQPHTRSTCVGGVLGLECTSGIVDGTELKETNTVFQDMAGRTLKTVAAAGTTDEAITSQSFYNTLGQLNKTKDADGVTQLFVYNLEGERTTSVLDLNGNGMIDYGSDQISFSDYTFIARDNTIARRSFTKVWRPQDQTASSGLVVSHTDSAINGLKSWSTQFPNGAALVSSSETTLLGNGNVTQKSISADGSYAISTTTAGLQDKAEGFSADGTKLHTNSITNAAGGRGYDSLNRVVATKNSRTGVSSRTYQSLVSDVITSSTDAAGFTTSVAYDLRGRTISIDAPDTLDKEGNVIANIKTTKYFSFGGVKEQSGDQTYKTSYTYDYALRRKTLTTYGTTTAVTTWNYSGTRGWLESKTYADGKGTSYGYTDAGRLASRKWARTVSGGQKLTTTYGYDSAGRQTGITHNDGAEAISTAPFSTSYDRLSRPTLITRGSANGGSESTWGYTYFADSLLLDKETITYGSNLATPELKRTLGRTYDTLLRPESQSLKTPTQGTEHSASYVYDNAGRLQKITDLQGNDYTYEYLTDAPSMIEKCISPVCVTTNTYEPHRNILKQKENKLVTATGDQTVSTFTYTVNGIGQRTGLITTGSAYGLNPVTLNWGYNNKGEVVQADHNNNTFDKSYDFDGIGNRNKTSDSLTLPAANNYVSNALNQYSNVNGVARTYDDDGNSLTGVVGTRGQLGEIKWDGNNRLTEVTTEDGKLVKVDYDHMGRRFRKSVTTGGETKYSYFIYSGYNAIAKYTGNSQSALSLQKSYYWGLDLGGGEGTGGMLAEVSHDSATESLFTLMDGNGNITEYLKSDGTVAAHFEYDSFGNTLVSEGAEASVVDYGFSSRAKDKDLGLVYYNFRYLNVVDGQWIQRDPLWEDGGFNLYSLVGNDSIGTVDILGLSGQDIPESQWYNPSIVPFRPTGTPIKTYKVPADIRLKGGLKSKNCGSCGVNFNIKDIFFGMTPLSSGETFDLALQMDISVSGEKCGCDMFRVMQIVRRGNIDAARDDKLEWKHFTPLVDQGGKYRTRRSHPTSRWRVDSGRFPEQEWFGKPWWDQNPNGEYWRRDSELDWEAARLGGNVARYYDRAGVKRHLRGLEFQTCVVKLGDKGYEVVGCLRWGFGVTKKGRVKKPGKAGEPEMFKAELFPFEVTCGKPEGFDDAISTWNKNEPNKISPIR